MAIPAESPDRRMRGIPTSSAKTPPTRAASTSDGTFPSECRARSEKRAGVIVGFSVTGIVITPAANAPTATKLTWPNETTPELPTKT